ncbi:asparagine synthase (glutamine-hydrolyzing) [Micromonospora sp. DT62]|uniref:asparagine synthase (glutamine-hydrolyzing) n=1 Tax=Micromonospora sp. DT62 TaxID=3416521 RepID=UPI003CFAE18E
MCGLAGIARFGGAPVTPTDHATLRAMGRRVAHRGPDASDLLLDSPVSMAFTRLSLTGVDNGDQPLYSEDEQVVLIANGEVYNHRDLVASLRERPRLRTASDCEVLAHLYAERGLSFLDETRGMFAIILWDRRRNQLVLARDRFGIKPLYFHQTADRIVLASEIKALFADPATPRQVNWEEALTSPFVTANPALAPGAPATFFRDVESVAPGTIVTIDLTTGSRSTHRYWTLPAAHERMDASDDELAASYVELLTESVAYCATSDSELGLFLSGGIDSAAVAALAARTTQMHTFSVLSGSTLLNGDAEHATRVARDIGLPHHQVLFAEDHVPQPDDWRRLVWLAESPTCGPEVYYKHELHRYAKAVRPELRGMLLGAASDEFNGGYSMEFTGEDGDWDVFAGSLRRMRGNGALLHRPELTPWWSMFSAPLLTDGAVELFTGSRVDDPYRDYLHHEHRKINQYNCWHEDRTAAGSGVEARVPFLDHRLVELVTSIPVARRRALLWDKTILRHGLRDVLPPEIVNRPKVPFFYGPGTAHTYRMLQRMLRQDGGALVEHALSSPTARQLIDPVALRAALADAESDPVAGNVELLLRLVNLGLLDAMTHELPPPVVEWRPPSPPRPSVEIDDWDAQAPRLEATLLAPVELGPFATFRLSPDALLLRSGRHPGEWYLARNGVIEYELDAGEYQQWIDTLNAMDGSRSLGELAAATGWSFDEMRPLLVEALNAGLIEPAPESAREPETLVPVAPGLRS